MSDFTLGGYMAAHDRAAAFSGRDGAAYSVAVFVDDVPDERGRFAASLLFVRWSPGGDRPVGHVQTGPLAWGSTPDEASLRLGGWSLYDVKQALDEAIAGGSARRMVTGLQGMVLARDGAEYRVQGPDGEMRAVLRGKVKRDTPHVVAGDVVLLEPEQSGDLWAIRDVLPRRNVLERRIPLGRGTRPVVANVDRVFVMTSTRDPAPLPGVIDRLLVLAEANDIPAVLLVNKVDLDPGESLASCYRAAGYEVLPLSVREGVGLDAVRAWLPGHATVVTGPSGSGKSSLLNVLEPGLGLRTRAISEKGRRGRQTTVSAQMVPLAGGGWLVDTPGFSEVGLWGLEPLGLAQCFPEMRPLLGSCKYGDCRHVDEPGCAIRSAVTRGAMAPARYESYCMLLRETEAEPAEWE